MTLPVREEDAGRRGARVGYTARQLLRRPMPTGPAKYATKLVSDGAIVAIKTGIFYHTIPGELDGWYLVWLEALVSTESSSGRVKVDAVNHGPDVPMLLDVAQIDAGEYSSHPDIAAFPATVDPAGNQVALGDRVRFDVTGAGTGAQGLAIEWWFSPVQVETG